MIDARNEVVPNSRTKLCNEKGNAVLSDNLFLEHVGGIESAGH